MNEEESSEDEATKKCREVTAECLDLLANRRPIEAATNYLGRVEEIMSDLGVPPAQIQYAAVAKSIDAEAYAKISIVASVDFSAVCNGVAEDHQEAAIRFASSVFRKLDACMELWAEFPTLSDDLEELDKQERFQICDAFRLAIGAVSLVRQFGYHFNPELSGMVGGHSLAPELDMEKLLTEFDGTGTAKAMCRNPSFQALMEFVMSPDAAGPEE